MDKNNFFYDKLKHNDSVQKFLKNADSMISCSKCSNNISDSNYCSKCGKNSIVVTKVNPNYLTTFLETSQKYTQITNLKKILLLTGLNLSWSSLIFLLVMKQYIQEVTIIKLF